jgi:hypothetical protein
MGLNDETLDYITVSPMNIQFFPSGRSQLCCQPLIQLLISFTFSDRQSHVCPQHGIITLKTVCELQK